MFRCLPLLFLLVGAATGVKLRRCPGVLRLPRRLAFAIICCARAPRESLWLASTLCGERCLASVRSREAGDAWA